MAPVELKNYFPKYGDIVAVSRYCTQNNKCTRKHSLLERLKKKMQKQGKSNCRPQTSSESDESDMQQNKKKKKPNRLVEIGWLYGKNGDKCKQVRTKHGGGTRQVQIGKDAKKEDILKEALRLFFPDGHSSKGEEKNYTFDILDFKNNPLSKDITVENLFKITGLTKLRFYLASYEKEKNSEFTEEHETAPSTSTSHMETFYTDFVGDLLEVEQSYSVVDFETEESRVTHFLAPTVPVYEIEEIASEVIVNDDRLVRQSPTLTTDLDLSDMIIPVVRVHRGHVFEDFLDYFKNFQPSYNTFFRVKMISANGSEENGVDAGGIFRDALSEFWETFYNTLTVGTIYRVPAIRHDFGEMDWKAVALILGHGWKKERYFPIKIAPIVFEFCVLGEIHSSLTLNFLKFISPFDAGTVKKALKQFDDVDEDELMDILTSYDCKWKPKKDNIEQLIKDIAHKELVQKPMYILKCWASHLQHIMTLEVLQDTYKNGEPTAKNILSQLKLINPSTLSSAEGKVFEFLKRFIKECTEEIRGNFLRFCTGKLLYTNVIHYCNQLLKIIMETYNFLHVIII